MAEPAFEIRKLNRVIRTLEEADFEQAREKIQDILSERLTKEIYAQVVPAREIALALLRTVLGEMSVEPPNMATFGLAMHFFLEGLTNANPSPEFVANMRSAIALTELHMLKSSRKDG